MYVITHRVRRRGTLGELGAGCAPPVGSQLLKAGVSTAASAAAGFGVSSLAILGSAAGPLGMVAGAVAGLVGGLLFKQSKHSQCAHNSVSVQDYLACTGEKPKDNYLLAWNNSKCGWYDYPYCCGARGYFPPATGCGPCDPSKTTCAPGSFSTGTAAQLTCTKDISAKIAAGQTIAAATGNPAAPGGSAAPGAGTILGLPWWMVAGGAAALVYAVI